VLNIILNNLSISKQNLTIFSRRKGEDILVVDDFLDILGATEVRVHLFYISIFLIISSVGGEKSQEDHKSRISASPIDSAPPIGQNLK